MGEYGQFWGLELQWTSHGFLKRWKMLAGNEEMESYDVQSLGIQCITT